ncbi:MAG: ATP-dependent metalloprotease, partial [Dokdonella sp.]
TSKRRLESRIATLFGGRVAEEIVFGPEYVTTGASNDIERATKMARNMVTKWGLSDKLGPIAYGEEEDEVFLGRSVTQHKNVSDETARRIDEEVREILDRAYARSTELLGENLDKLHVMADALLQYETIDAQQIEEIMSGREVSPPKDWTKDSGAGPGPESGGAKPRGENPIGGPAVQSRSQPAA